MSSGDSQEWNNLTCVEAKRGTAATAQGGVPLFALPLRPCREAHREATPQAPLMRPAWRKTIEQEGDSS